MRFPEPVRCLVCGRDMHVPEISRATVDGGCPTRGAAQLQGVAHPHWESPFLLGTAWHRNADNAELKVMISFI